MSGILNKILVSTVGGVLLSGIFNNIATILGFKTHYQMSLVSPLLFLHRETRQNWRNNWMLINTYIPVISYTKLNFVTCVGLS
jgi:hypothetical protein